jgi:hypothetical protein
MKYGSDGYALYFYCLEIIAGELSPENITFELEHDAEILAYKLKIDSLRVEEIMNYCVSLGLYQFNPATKRIMCLTLAKRVDIYMSRNPEIAKIRSKIKDIPKVFEHTSKKVLPHDMILHDITLHDTILHDKKDTKNKKFVIPDLPLVTEYFVKNGYTAQAAEKFHAYYTAGDWNDRNGKPVRNWKQKAQAVWFKPENKQAEKYIPQCFPMGGK